ncbi:MAG: hypothetical protein ACXABH_00980 [Candidatus Thorarchaeota archaeon]|jgi:hypothetical protein
MTTTENKSHTLELYRNDPQKTPFENHYQSDGSERGGVEPW